MTMQQGNAPVALEWTLGDRLRKALRVADMSVNEMADCLGVSRNTVSNYLADRTHPGRGDIIAWALRCGVPFEWLLNGTATTGPDNGPDKGDALTRWLTLAA